MKRVVKAASGSDSFVDVLKGLVSELEATADKFCKDNDLSWDTWGEVNDFDKNYDETVDVNFSVTIDIPDEEE